MKELILLCTMAVFFLGGYFVMKKLDVFFGESLRLPDDEGETQDSEK